MQVASRIVSRRDAAAVAILIRPNLVPVALVLAVWLAAKDYRLPTFGARFANALLFSAPVVFGCFAVAAINQQLYGSMTSSGYGDPGRMFALGHVVQNVMNYASWLMSSQTPVAVIGMIALWVPSWPLIVRHVEIEEKTFLGAVCFAVVACYLFYLPFDAWWYLRFLLPCWPLLCVGTARLLAYPSGVRFTRTGTVLLCSLGVYGLWYAYAEGSFGIGRGEQRFVTVARLVRNATPPNSVIISMQHSGSVRYYGERMTLRYEVLSQRWLDGTVAWLQKRGVHAYILLDDWEHDPFKEKFAKRNVLGRLDVAKVFEYWDNTSTSLYDPLEPTRGAERTLVLTRDNVPRTTTCEPCGAMPRPGW